MFDQSFSLAAQLSITWHVIPLAVVVSLVYSASRFELPEAILQRSARLFGTILLFMGVVFLVLYLLSFGL